MITRRHALAGMAGGAIAAPFLAIAAVAGAPTFALDTRVDPTIALAAERHAAAQRFDDACRTDNTPRRRRYWQALYDVYDADAALAELTPTTPAGWQAMFGVVARMHGNDTPSYIKIGMRLQPCEHPATPLVRRLEEGIEMRLAEGGGS